MKKISILIACYNEEKNVVLLTKELTKELNKLKKYDYEIIYIDNHSIDSTRSLLREICKKDKKVKCIFNIGNFGQFNSPYYGLLQTSGDCVIKMCADFQDPVEMIPKFIKAWEDGYRVVCGVKTSSKENGIIYKLRGLYYKILKKFSNVEIIEQFTGFGLYDKSFIEILRELDDPTPFLRGVVAEYGNPRLEIPYNQPKRINGKSKNNFYTLYDAAMLSFTSYTKIGMRLAIFIGAIFSFISILIGIVYLIAKILYWDRFVAGQAPTLIIISIMCSLILTFLGVLGEYILAINQRVINRPLVIEEERINFKKN